MNAPRPTRAGTLARATDHLKGLATAAKATLGGCSPPIDAYVACQFLEWMQPGDFGVAMRAHEVLVEEMVYEVTGSGSAAPEVVKIVAALKRYVEEERFKSGWYYQEERWQEFEARRPTGERARVECGLQLVR